MATYSVEPIASNLHGNFSRDHEPILIIDSGDTVVFRTLEASWQIKDRTSLEDPPEYIQGVPEEKRRGDGHCLCGPIAIRGAQPGMTLEVRIEEVCCGTWGWTNSGGWSHWVHEKLGTDRDSSRFFWTLDSKNGVGRDQWGHEVQLRPFLGVMGMPPNEVGFHSTIPPRATGGNLDCKELVAGTTLYLPIAVENALFSIGDGHAAQGDGEVCVTAIECPMEVVRLTFILHPKMSIKSPRARIDGAWLTTGLSEDLDEACLNAISELVDLMEEIHPELDRATCLGLASIAADVRVTQLVNETKGAHAILRDDAIKFPIRTT